MKRKLLRWLIRGTAVLLVGWCLTSIVLSQIVLERQVVVSLTGETGGTVEATITVDGQTTHVSRTLPASFEHYAKYVLIEAKSSQQHSNSHISGSLHVNGVKLGSVGAPAGQGVRLGFKAPGLLGQGKRKVWISGISANELAAWKP